MSTPSDEPGAEPATASGHATVAPSGVAPAAGDVPAAAGRASMLARAAPLLPVLLLVAAFHDSWRWLANRTAGSPEEAVTLAVVVAAVAIAVARRLLAGHRLVMPPPLPLAAALLASAGLVAAGAPRIVVASLASTATLGALWYAGHGRRPPAAFLALASLVLPWVPTLQFYFGYPMRIVCSALTVPLLWLAGRPVGLDGTALTWQGGRVEFDAPCSGVAMAWAASLLVLAAATIAGLDWRRTLGLLVTGLKLVAIANVMRAAALFHLETGLVVLPGDPDVVHRLVGVAAFGAAALAIVHMLRRRTA